MGNHTLHRHPFAPTQAGAALIAQRIHYFANVFKRCCMEHSMFMASLEPLKACFHKQIAIQKWRWVSNAINHALWRLDDLFDDPFRLIA